MPSQQRMPKPSPPKPRNKLEMSDWPDWRPPDVPGWKEAPDIHSRCGRYHLREFCFVRREKVYVHMPTGTIWTAAQVDAIFPDVL
jgi:hypothetical protein